MVQQTIPCDIFPIFKESINYDKDQVKIIVENCIFNNLDYIYNDKSLVQLMKQQISDTQIPYIDNLVYITNFAKLDEHYKRQSDIIQQLKDYDGASLLKIGESYKNHIPMLQLFLRTDYTDIKNYTFHMQNLDLIRRIVYGDQCGDNCDCSKQLLTDNHYVVKKQQSEEDEIVMLKYKLIMMKP